MTGPSEPEEHVDLVALVRGELSTADVLSAGDHLHACAACRTDLVDTAVGHAVLARASRTQGAPVLPSPVPPPVLPPLRLDQGRSAGRGRRLVAVAAAAAVVAAVGGVVAWQVSDDDGGPESRERVVALGAVGDGPAGELRTASDASGTDLTIVADLLPAAGAGEFYQAWLLDPDTNKMLSLGPLSGATSRFRVDRDLMAAYPEVDVSLESDDGDPAHSATSVLRGGY